MTESVSHQIQEKILSKIKDLDLKPGDRLPSERALAQAFGVSRNTVREAVRALAEKKVLESRRGSGSYVTRDAAQIIAETLSKKIKEKRLRLAEVFEVRKLLEPVITALAGQKISTKDLALLESHLVQQKNAFDQGKSPVEFDEAFHTTLVKATGNSVLCSVYDTLRETLAESRAPELQNRERARRSLDAHRKILEALKTGKPDLAARQMTLHMEGIQTILNQGIYNKKELM